MNSLSQNKKIIYVVAGAIVLTLLGFLAYRFLLAPAGEQTTTTGGEITGGRLPNVSTNGEVVTPTGEASKIAEIEALKPGETTETAPEQTLTRLTDYPVISPSLNTAENKILFYKKDGGDLLSLNFDGTEEEKVSNVTIVGLLEAFWSGNRDKAGVFYLDGETLKGFLYLGESGVAVLPQNIKSFSWSPDGKSLAYLLPKDARLDLVIADSSGKNAKTVFSTPILDSQIKWITSDKLAFQTAPSASADGFIFVYSRASGSFTRIAGPTRGLTSLWSPDGSRAIIKDAGTKNPSQLIGGSGGASRDHVFRNTARKMLMGRKQKTLLRRAARWHGRNRYARPILAGRDKYAGPNYFL